MCRAFARECGCWSQLAVISRETLAGCLESLEWLMSPLLYQLSYTAREDGTYPGARIQEWFKECLARLA
jgi:hypothetical protein